MQVMLPLHAACHLGLPSGSNACRRCPLICRLRRLAGRPGEEAARGPNQGRPHIVLQGALGCRSCGAGRGRARAWRVSRAVTSA